MQDGRMAERKFRTSGGGVVTWTYTRDVGDTQVGTFTCSGCRGTSRPTQWGVANEHAIACCQIP